MAMLQELMAGLQHFHPGNGAARTTNVWVASTLASAIARDIEGGKFSAASIHTSFGTGLAAQLHMRASVQQLRLHSDAATHVLENAAPPQGRCKDVGQVLRAGPAVTVAMWSASTGFAPRLLHCLRQQQPKPGLAFPSA
eukprot:6192329-Amphidinium_carterae.1